MTDLVTQWATHRKQCHRDDESERLGDLMAAEIGRLRDALKPFSDEAGWWFERNYHASDAPVEGFSDYQGVMTCGDLFKARAVFQSK